MKDNLTYDEAVQILKENGGYGKTRLYAEFKDGVYKGQIDAPKSINQLDELTSAYRVRLYAKTTTFDDLVQVVKIS